MYLIEVKMTRMMITDDSKLVRSTLKDMLELGRHQVVSEVADGVDTLEKFNSANPDVLLLDIAIPKKTVGNSSDYEK